MKHLLPLSALAAALLLAGCQAVNTTSGGAVGVERKQYMFSALSTQEVNQMYAQSYQQTLGEASSKGVLDKTSNNAKRLRTIADRLIKQAPLFRPDSAQWQWEVNLIKSPELNANCGPGGKIIFYSGIIDKLDLTDDEIAAIMGHEMAHALREHARERVAKTQATGMGLSVLSQLLGLGNLGDVAANLGTQLLSLQFSREDETEADLVGLELAARSAYRPQASVSLWQKMSAANGKGGPSFLSTHPTGPERIRDLQANVPKVQGLYEQARRG
jgi:Zn-dependent protease with chaperone function